MSARSVGHQRNAPFVSAAWASHWRQRRQFWPVLVQIGRGTMTRAGIIMAIPSKPRGRSRLLRNSRSTRSTHHLARWLFFPYWRQLRRFWGRFSTNRPLGTQTRAGIIMAIPSKPRGGSRCPRGPWGTKETPNLYLWHRPCIGGNGGSFGLF